MVMLLPLWNLGWAQKPMHEAKFHTGKDSKLFWNKSLPLYIRIGTSPEDEGVLLKSENQSAYVNPLYLDTEGVNYIRTRWAVDRESKQAITPQIEIKMEVYADGTPPESNDTFLNAPEYEANKVRYWGKGLTL